MFHSMYYVHVSVCHWSKTSGRQTRTVLGARRLKSRVPRAEVANEFYEAFGGACSWLSPHYHMITLSTTETFESTWTNIDMLCEPRCKAA